MERIDLSDKRFDRDADPAGPCPEDARQSDCVLVGCGDCRTLMMNGERDALVQVLTRHGIMGRIMGPKWNRYLTPGGGVNLSRRFPDTQRHRDAIAFYVEHQLREETLIVLVHAGCGWVRTNHPDMCFRETVEATIGGAREFQCDLKAVGKTVQIVVVADFLGANSERYVVCAIFPCLT